ncbi:hypothetical protein [Allokutzneria albata]|uniref:PE family protein n=1 Tax=Allokutzneria albata TaxID=211114 RepID=A0A1H0AXC9_ALLAB|nr:hypothetical protein [Allokutzneria albata]SDN38077.1 hypothetical protein SAMN04489726_6338 [Allokutzneria albata]
MTWDSNPWERDGLAQVGNMVSSGEIRMDAGTKEWVTNHMDELIAIALAELRAARQFASKAQDVDFGATRAGQAMRAKFIHRSSDQEGGLTWFWQRYHDALVEFRKRIVGMATALEKNDQKGAELQWKAGS